MKEMWRTIKKFWPYLKKSNITPSSPTNKSTLDLANYFNDFFVNVGSTLAAQIPVPDTELDPYIHHAPAFEFSEVDLEEIVCIIGDLSPTNARSLDGITP